MPKQIFMDFAPQNSKTKKIKINSKPKGKKMKKAYVKFEEQKFLENTETTIENKKLKGKKMKKVYVEMEKQQFSGNTEPTIREVTTKDLIDVIVKDLDRPMYFDKQKNKMCYEQVPMLNRSTLSKLSKKYVGSLVLKAMSETAPCFFNPIVMSKKYKTYYNRSDSVIASLLPKDKMAELQEKAWVLKEYDTYVWIDPDNRARNLYKVITEGDIDRNSKKFQAFICDVWCSSEHDLESINIFADIFKTFAGCKYFETSKKDLPEEIQIFRGGTTDNSISWTMNKDIAEYFQKRHTDCGFKGSKLWKKQVNKANIICFIKDSSEEDVIILPDNPLTGECNG